MITELEKEEKKLKTYHDKKVTKVKKKGPKRYNRKDPRPPSAMPRSAFNRKSYFWHGG